MRRKSNFIHTAAITLLTLVFILTVYACKKEEPPKDTGPENSFSQIEMPEESGGTKDVTPSLRQVLESAKYWNPVFQNWYGKKAPDFSLKGIAGKTHQLSSYKGKNVIIVLWATWCGPCKIEIPHLIALRNLKSRDELAILAISNEPESLVKDYARKNKLNYTVITANTVKLPEPYNKTKSIPASFFIDKEGNIKLATVGPLSLGNMRNILNAE